MKNFIVIFSALILTSCLTQEQLDQLENVDNEDFCYTTKITSEVRFELELLSTDPKSHFKMMIDGIDLPEKAKDECYDSSLRCLLEIKKDDKDLLKARVSFPLADRASLIDFALIEVHDDGEERIRMEKESFSLSAWKNETKKTGFLECQKTYFSTASDQEE